MGIKTALLMSVLYSAESILSATVKCFKMCTMISRKNGLLLSLKAFGLCRKCTLQDPGWELRYKYKIQYKNLNLTLPRLQSRPRSQPFLPFRALDLKLFLRGQLSNSDETRQSVLSWFRLNDKTLH